MATNTSSSLIATIVDATGLPPEIWLVIPPLQAPRDGEVSYTLESTCADDFVSMFSPKCKHMHWVQLHNGMISTLLNLLVAYILSQGVLICTITNFMIMVSIAETAFVLLRKTYSDLLWAMLEVAEWELRADTVNEQWQHSILKRTQEIREAKHIETLRERERERE